MSIVGIEIGAHKSSGHLRAAAEGGVLFRDVHKLAVDIFKELIPFGVGLPKLREAFGHVGLVNKFAWGDPQRQLSAAILTSGIPVLAHHLVPMVNVLRVISNTFPRLEREARPFALQLA